MSNGNSLINFGDLSKPATVFIEKISDAMTGAFRPFQIRRVAKAEAEADLIRTRAQLDITDLEQRALVRFVAEESKKQENMEQIINKVIPMLEESSDPRNMEDDWITNFFDKSRIISDEEMQLIWAKVLAGEANHPGTYSKRTVNLLNSLDKTDAQLFVTLCSFAWVVEGDFCPLVFQYDAPLYKERGLSFVGLTHLDAIGLVTFDATAGFGDVFESDPTEVTVRYFDSFVTLQLNDKRQISIGQVLLTRVGRELAPICGAEPVAGFVDYVVEEWAKEGVILSSPYPRVS